MSKRFVFCSQQPARRSKNWIYPLTMCGLYVAYVVGDLLAFYNETECVNLVADLVYYCTWPLLTFLALLLDSNYWRNVGRPEFCDAKSRAVVRRLAGARHGEFAAVRHCLCVRLTTQSKKKKLKFSLFIVVGRRLVKECKRRQCADRCAYHRLCAPQNTASRRRAYRAARAAGRISRRRTGTRWMLFYYD
jgi:hypothetical protein